MADRRTKAALALGLLFAFAQAVDVTSTFGVLNYDAAALVGLLAAVIGLRRNRPAYTLPWHLLLAGLAMFVVADLLWNAYYLSGSELIESTSWLDALYLGAYGPLAAGAFLLARRRAVALGREAILDALALLLPAAAITWSLLIEPSLTDGMSTIDLAVLIAYPVLDVVCLGVAFWLGFGPRPLTAQRFLLAGLAATFAADTSYALLESMGVELPVDDVAWVVGYVFLGVAFLHPSMTRVGAPEDQLRSRLTKRRFVLLGTAPAIIPAVHSVKHWSEPGELILGSAGVLVVVLVVARLAGLLREVDQARRAEVRAERRFRAFVQDAGELLVVLDREHRVSYASPAVTTVLGYDPDQVVGVDAGEFVHPDDLDSVWLAVSGVGQRPGDTVRFQYRCRLVDGSWRWLDATATNLLIDPDVDGIVLHQRDVTSQRAAADALRIRARQQEAVARIGTLALDGTPIEQLLDEAVSLVRSTLGVLSCQLFRLVRNGEVLVLEAASGPARACVGTLKVPAYNDSQAGYTMTTGQPVVSGDLVADTRFARPSHLSANLRSGASVVVGGPDGLHGVLIVHAFEPNAFTAEDIAFLQSAANAIALVLQRRATEADIRWRALHDGLTGLPNRGHVLEFIERLLTSHGPGDVAVLFCDVDHFKVVNDGLGHDTGDQLLVAVADRLRTAASASDMVARFGGDEFVVVRAGVQSRDDAVALAARLLDAIGQPVDLHGDRLQLDASIGIAIVRRGTDATAMSVLRDADAAMYRAKERGRARYEVFDDELREQVVHRLRTEAALRLAIANDELRLHYQPVVDLRTGEIVAVEALLRWLREDGQLIQPCQFIPIAEEHGVIDEIGAWVLHEACRQIAMWSAAGRRLEVAVNVAPRQLLGGELPGVVRAACAASGVEPTRVTLELTERALLRDADAAVRAMHELADLGVQLSIDDFGTGWSSLAYLKRLPVTELKVDRTFVSEMTEGGPDAAIVEATVRLGSTLGLRTVGEGIERPEHAAALTRLGCDRGQGYLLCPPLPPEELALERFTPITANELAN